MFKVMTKAFTMFRHNLGILQTIALSPITTIQAFVVSLGLSNQP